MKRTSFLLAGAVLIAGMALAQAPSAVKKAPAKAAYTPPKTPDGQPDIQGVWTNATITPFERPTDLASKAVLSDEEAAAVEKTAAANRVDRAPAAGDPGTYNQFWFDSGTKVLSTKQTSMVVDPPDGRVPLKPEAIAKREYDLAHVTDSYEYMSVWDRCITRGVPAGMFPAGYNNAHQIVQVPGYVMILDEMIHNARVIPIDGRPHLPAEVKQWDGDSRGHWEGNTLVIDTTNFNGKGWISSSAAGGRIKGIHESQQLHLTEKLTRVDPETLMYEVTIEDPTAYTKPWKVAMPMSKDAEYRLYEYACHEGNLAVGNILGGGRVADARE
jgi:hypothetical protein